MIFTLGSEPGGRAPWLGLAELSTLGVELPETVEAVLGNGRSWALRVAPLATLEARYEAREGLPPRGPEGLHGAGAAAVNHWFETRGDYVPPGERPD